MRVSTVVKKPTEKFSIGFQYSSVDLAENTTISSVAVSISPSGNADDLALEGTATIDGTTVAAMIKKGRDSYEYYVTFTTTTSAGQIFVDKVFVKVRA